MLLSVSDFLAVGRNGIHVLPTEMRTADVVIARGEIAGGASTDAGVLAVGPPDIFAF